MIRNNANDKKYIGSSKGIKERWLTHIREFETGDFNKCNFKNDYYNYGEEVFLFCLLEQINNVNELKSKEDYYINFFDTTNIEKGYNMRPSNYKFLPQKGLNILKFLEDFEFQDKGEICTVYKETKDEYLYYDDCRRNLYISKVLENKIYEHVFIPAQVKQKVDNSQYKDLEKYERKLKNVSDDKLILVYLADLIKNIKNKEIKDCMNIMIDEIYDRLKYSNLNKPEVEL
jgi:hypothetical protein